MERIAKKCKEEKRHSKFAILNGVSYRLKLNNQIYLTFQFNMHIRSGLKTLSPNYKSSFLPSLFPLDLKIYVRPTTG